MNRNRFRICSDGAVRRHSALCVVREPPTGWCLRRNWEPLNYLPIKIKMPAVSATTPITIAPKPI